MGVDGLGASAVRGGSTPHLKALMKRGAWTLQARGVMPTVSSPNWASIIMGAGPEQHGITSNEWQADKFEIAGACTLVGKHFPTIFGVLRQARPKATIAVFHDWEGFGRLVEDGVPQQIEHVLKSPVTIRKAIEHWTASKPDLMFVHLDDVDHAGHRHGWGSPEYKAAVEDADALIGSLVAAVGDGTNVFVVADHGGVGTKHGGLTMEELLVPWIAAGPAIVRDRELTTLVNSLDTATTIARILGLRTPDCWTGRPVLPALKMSK